MTVGSGGSPRHLICMNLIVCEWSGFGNSGKLIFFCLDSYRECQG